MTEGSVMKGFQIVKNEREMLELGKNIGSIEIYIRLEKGLLYDMFFVYPRFQGIPESVEKVLMFIARCIDHFPRKRHSFPDEKKVIIRACAGLRKITLSDVLDNNWDQWQQEIVSALVWG